METEAKAPEKPRVEDWLWLVPRVASNIRRRSHPDYQDLLQEGRIALMRACELCEPDPARPFEWYAKRAIRKRMHRAISQEGTVRLPPWVTDLSYKVRARLEDPATIHPRKRATLADAERVRSGVLRECDGFDPSLVPGGRGDEPIADDPKAEAERLMAKLTPRERAIVSARFGLDGKTPMKLADLAKRFGWKHGESARQVVAKALSRMREGEPEAA